MYWSAVRKPFQHCNTLLFHLLECFFCCILINLFFSLSAVLNSKVTFIPGSSNENFNLAPLKRAKGAKVWTQNHLHHLDSVTFCRAWEMLLFFGGGSLSLLYVALCFYKRVGRRNLTTKSLTRHFFFKVKKKNCSWSTEPSELHHKLCEPWEEKTIKRCVAAHLCQGQLH